MSITTAQIRGARGLLDWSQAELSRRTGISTTSIGNIESGNTQARESTLLTIRKAFENAGIEFIGKEGVRTQIGDVRVYEGNDGFREFFDDIYITAKNDGGEILVSNVDERVFLKHLGDYAFIHSARMKDIENLSYKIMIREGDDYLPASTEYAVEYRAINKEQFSSVPFYIYGKKLAIILFSPEPTVIVLNYQAVAVAYTAQFEAMWSSAKPVSSL